MEYISIILAISKQFKYNVYMLYISWLVCFIVFNVAFNDILAISWRYILLVEETGGPGENQRPAASHWQTYYIMLYTSLWAEVESKATVVIDTDYIDSYKFNYHTITATTAPLLYIMSDIKVDQWQQSQILITTEHYFVSIYLSLNLDIVYLSTGFRIADTWLTKYVVRSHLVPVTV